MTMGQSKLKYNLLLLLESLASLEMYIHKLHKMSTGQNHLNKYTFNM